MHKRLRQKLVGWIRAVVERKVSPLATILVQTNEIRDPNLLSVCEVENKEVLPRRVTALQPLDRNDAVAHHEAQDGHGIDVAFVYDEN